MDAGTASLTNKIRPVYDDQIYGNQAQQQQQFYQQMPQGSTSNYDLIQPHYSMTNSSRKASMTSQSTKTMSKLFKRGKVTGEYEEAQDFDEETGIDIQNITGHVSFDDITHIRGRGPYSMAGGKTLDTTPIIPTLGGGGNLSNPSKLNNVQYRKQMNHQMKLQMQQASNARTMSLSGGNPTDPRTMSLAGGNPTDPRAMSLAGNPSDPRAMSFNSFSNRTMSLTPNGNGANGPRTMSLMNQYPQNPRSMSLRNNPMNGQMRMPPQMMNAQMMNGQMMNGQMMNGQMMNGQMMNGQMVNGQMMNGQMMNGQMAPQMYMPMNGQMPMNGMMMNGQMMNGQTNGQMNGQMTNNQMNGQMMNGQINTQTNSQSNYPGYKSNNTTPINQSSNDSLMNVVEEEEDDEAHIHEPSMHQGQELEEYSDEDKDEEDVVYRFDNEDDDKSLSRKSTLKKSNSMRLRKLNLFDNVEEETTPKTSPLRNNYETSPVRDNYETEQRSPSFNARNQEYRESMVKSASDEINHLTGNQDKFGKIGANVNESNVYYTANDLNDFGEGSLPSPNLRDSYHSKDSQSQDYQSKDIQQDNLKFSPLKQTTFPPSVHSGIEENVESEYDDDDEEDTQIIESPQLPKQQSSRSLTQNTAFHNFRSSSHKLNEYAEDLGIIEDSKDTPPTTNSSHSEKNFSTMTPVNMTPKNTTPINTTPTNNSKRSSLAETDSSKKPSRNSSRTKNFLKRLSGKRSSSNFSDDDDRSFRRLSNSTPIKSAPTASTPKGSVTPKFGTPNERRNSIQFSKEELGIMTANNELLNELELVTTELASSIKRELTLESRIKNKSPNSANSGTVIPNYEEEIRSKSKTIVDLQEKLTKERRLRYISEEHALLLENGQSPSPLKLNYEKTELYRQLLIKNDLCNQLQDKLNEQEANETNDYDPNLVDKYNEILKENADLKLRTIPELERQIQVHHQSKDADNSRQFSLVNSYDYDNSEIEMEVNDLKSQRDELRDVITKLNSSHNYEMKLAVEKVKSMQMKLREQSELNDKLKQRLNTNHNDNGFNNGGKLQGFSIVSPTKSLFDN